MRSAERRVEDCSSSKSRVTMASIWWARRLHSLAVGAGGLGQGGAEPGGGHGAMGQVVVEVAAGAPVGFGSHWRRRRTPPQSGT